MAFASVAAVASTGAPIPDDGECRRGKGIERMLGSHGYRVVVSGGYAAASPAVKVQIWENDERDWVLTEAFMNQNRTCVVRSGIRLHMMY
ncbi:hypothetical protein [Arhodomonas sp. SL1]|uniref:hypothetical protein n=1 Tax=Arhodomonas sp. SL1 TaxID=3425691 RepID=UPI003F881C61